MLSAQSFTITGHYVDKLNHSIDTASVKYYHENEIIAQTNTDYTGFFLLSVQRPTGLTDEGSPPSHYALEAYPNPFNPRITIRLTCREPGWFRMFDLTGRLIAQRQVSHAGEVLFTWGGVNDNHQPVSSGLYFLQFVGATQRFTQKVTLLDGGSEPLRLQTIQPLQTALSKPQMPLQTDSLVFHRTNTTPRMLFWETFRDTTITVTGNSGPVQTTSMPDEEITIGDTLRVNLNDYFYNDDANNYSSQTPGVTIQDSTLQVVGEELGDKNIGFSVIDEEDSGLEKQASFNLHVNGTTYFTFEVPDQSIEEDFAGSRIIDDLNEYINLPVGSEADTSNLEYELLSQSNEELVSTVLDGRAVDIAYLEPDGYGTSSVRLRAWTPEYADTSSFNLEVSAVNDAPVAEDDSVNTTEQTATTIDVLANDYDVDGDELSISHVSNPAHGTTTITNNRVVYTSEANFGGVDTFDYVVSDGSLSDTASVYVDVGAVNEAPVANDDNASTDEDTPVSVDVLANDTDPDGDALSITDIGNPSHGTTEISGNEITYTPTQNYNGSDSFNYTITDGEYTSTATVGVDVAAVNDPPVFEGDVADMSVDEDTQLLIDAAQHFTDVDDEVLDYIVQGLGSNASQSEDNGIITITPSQDWNGTLSGLVLEASDNEYTVQSNSFDIIVNAVNDAPELTLDEVVGSVSENASTPLTIATISIYDPDDTQHTVNVDTDNGNVTIESQGSNIVLTDIVDGWDGTVNYSVTASDGSLSDTKSEDLQVTPVAEVTFRLMSVYPDTLVTTPGGQFVIGGQTYDAQAGTLKVQLDPGTYEFNATHDSSVDGGGVELLFLREPGMQENIEQRSRYDNSSPITIGTQDKIILAYKVMNNYNMYIIRSYLDKNTYGIRRFARGLDVPFWWDDNYLPSDSSDWGDPVQWTYDVMEQLSEIPHSDITMHFEESTQQPDTPYLTMKVGEEFPSPGTNSTDYDETTNEIILARARYPPWPGEGTWKTEIYQAFADLDDVAGHDPQIFTTDNQGKIILNETGKQLFALYFIADPGTKL